MIKFKRTIKEVVKGGFYPPDTTKEENVFKPTDSIEAVYPEKVEEKPKEPTKKGRKKKNV